MKAKANRRYETLIEEVLDCAPRRIIEIGVWNGINGSKMIKAASKFHHPENISYWGFDLWEDLNPKLKKKEFSAKKIVTKAQAKKVLDTTCANITLIQGNTRETLKHIENIPLVDFIFIDGGHSLGTIASDWNYIKEKARKNTIVIFDDFYEDPKLAEKMGCNQLIYDLTESSRWRVNLLKPIDPVNGGTRLARVERVFGKTL